jgi:enamine deaminase RidA (YjgF/YER057c/UK114 family)
MSTLTYHFDATGPGQVFSNTYHYAQTVVLDGGVVKASGQGGWDLQGNLDPDDIHKQTQLAIENVDRVLREAGLRGWEDVYSLHSYHTDISQSFEVVSNGLKERIPNHRPIWTAVGVAALAVPTMRIELQVEARRSS